MDYDRYIVVKEGEEGKPQPRINKTTIVLVAMLLIFLILIVILLSGGQNNKGYTDENDFKIIKETPYITVYDNGIVSVPIERITNGQGEEGSYGDELFYVNGEQVLFYLYGMYEGEEISKSKYEVDEDGNITYYMRITKNLVPNDNVLDGYMLESLEENTPYIYIYLDSDWKKRYGNSVNVVIYSDGDYKEIPFDWSNEVYNGIYMMKIRDTMERFENNDFSEVLYPVFVGNFGLKEMKGEVNRTDITAIKMV